MAASSPCFDLTAAFFNISHVAKTGDIKQFVIIEEAGIAKGIRRVIAITGEEARQASLLAESTEARFESIVKLDPKEKDKAIKIFETVRRSEPSRYM